jgi:hypothetical protein
MGDELVRDFILENREYSDINARDTYRFTLFCTEMEIRRAVSISIELVLL